MRVITKAITEAISVIVNHCITLSFNEKLTLIISSIAIFMSVAAIFVSGASFYWSFIKDRSILHLVYVDKLGRNMEPQFAIVNGGKSDILITRVSCTFHYDKPTKNTFTPAQTIEWVESESSILPSGKAVHCKVTFTEKFTKTFLLKGRSETVGSQNLNMHDMYIDITWIEMDGKTFNRSVKFSTYGFNEDGKIMHKIPLRFRKPVNLYKIKS